MAIGKKTGGGLRSGSKNKDRVSVEARMLELGCDPLQAMVEIAQEARDAGDLALSAKIHGDLLQYIRPRLRSVEHSGPDGGAIQVTRIERVIVSDQPELLQR